MTIGQVLGCLQGQAWETRNWYIQVSSQFDAPVLRKCSLPHLSPSHKLQKQHHRQWEPLRPLELYLDLSLPHRAEEMGGQRRGATCPGSYSTRVSSEIVTLLCAAQGSTPRGLSEPIRLTEVCPGQEGRNTRREEQQIKLQEGPEAWLPEG